MQKRLGLDLEVADEFGWMMGGYTVGEACFLAFIHKRKDTGRKELHVKFYIKVRADDKAGLEHIRDTLGIGTVYDRGAYRQSAAAAEYQVHRIGDLYHVIIPLFEKYPLPQQWHKAHEFEVWKEIVEIKYREGGMHSLGKPPGSQPLPESYWQRIEALIGELRALRIYP